ncbi:uncharacterized protein EDB91DRAFT_1094661 [Suillus paluster]|uniref:uncharacterized protein n=1 Tax=Suillus paluster TaxID=48578 RepID=UPI001B86AF82|nr:uncharacterized protein EDB91DRAFT_1094661 [Suillus paluster]KAG1756831.1 hypothetical protein EDB91DRAFT_1094661 [Suillus paluster]
MDTPPMTLTCAQCARKLGDLVAQLPVNDIEETWKEVELTAQQLANGLRVRDGPEDNHTMLGKSLLPQNLTTLLGSALNGTLIPGASRTAPVFEILRVGANLCVEHDQNRGHLLEAGFPQAVVSLLEGYTDTIPEEPQMDPFPMSIAHLQVVKTAVGVLLNATLTYEPVRNRLTSLEVAKTIVRLSTALYPPAAWMRTTSNLYPPETSPDDITFDRISESWAIRAGLSSWAGRLISELQDDVHPLFSQEVLPYLVQSLIAFTPPLLAASPPPHFAQPSQLRTTLLNTDFDLLSESCSHLESSALDVADVRLSLARGFTFPAEHHDIPCFSAMLDFVEKGGYAPLWYVQSENGLEGGDVSKKEKAFDDCKAAVIKAVVEVSGDDRNLDILWDDSDDTRPGGEFVSRMIDWIRSFVSGGTYGNERDDLVICATLSLGNITRGESHSTILLSQPYDIARLLSSDALLAPSTDIKLKHGVIGLLKHLAQSSSQMPSNRATLSAAGVIQLILRSGVWDDRSDFMLDIVQVNAIGVVKHLCNNSVDNACVFILEPVEGQDPPSTGLSQLLALVKRSDTSTRIIVNLIRSLWTNERRDEISNEEELQARQQKRVRAMDALLTPACAEALAALIGRSAKHLILINEGVVASSLLSMHRDGGALVLNALTTPLPVEVTPSSTGSAPVSTTTSVASETMDSPIILSPTGTSNKIPSVRHALDQLIVSLKSESTPAEVRTNICAFFGQISKRGTGEGLQRLKEATRPILEELVSVHGHSMLGSAAKRVLDMWISE